MTSPSTDGPAAPAFPPLPDLPAPAEVTPVDVPATLARITAALDDGTWHLAPGDPIGAQMLLYFLDSTEDQESRPVRRSDGISLPACPDGPSLLRRALDIESTWDVVAGHRTGTGFTQQGPAGFMFLAITVGVRPIDHLAPAQVWKTYSGHTAGRIASPEMVAAFEQAYLAPHREFIDAAEQRIAEVLRAARRLADARGQRPADGARQRDATDLLFGFPHRGWTSKQRTVWDSGFELPGAPPPPVRDSAGQIIRPAIPRPARPAATGASRPADGQPPLPSVEVLTEAIRRMPDHPLVREGLRHLDFDKATASAGLTSPADRIAVPAQILATLVAFHTGGLGVDDGPWHAAAEMIIDAARGNDTGYLHGLTETALGSLPPGQADTVKWRLETAVFNTLLSAGTDVEEFDAALGMLTAIAALPDVPADWLVPAAALLAVAIADHDANVARIVETLRDDAGPGERLGGLWSLLLAAYTAAVGATLHLMAATGPQRVGPLLNADGDLAANPMRLACARILTAMPAAAGLAGPERDDRAEDWERELAELGEPEVWLPEMLLLLATALGRWSRHIVEQAEEADEE